MTGHRPPTFRGHKTSILCRHNPRVTGPNPDRVGHPRPDHRLHRAPANQDCSATGGAGTRAHSAGPGRPRGGTIRSRYTGGRTVPRAGAFRWMVGARNAVPVAWAPLGVLWRCGDPVDGAMCTDGPGGKIVNETRAPSGSHACACRLGAQTSEPPRSARIHIPAARTGTMCGGVSTPRGSRPSAGFGHNRPNCPH